MGCGGRCVATVEPIRPNRPTQSWQAPRHGTISEMESHGSSPPADLTNSTTRGRQRSQIANTHCSWKVRTSIHVVSGRFSLSLYVGNITEYFFLLEADGVAPVCDLVTTILLCTAGSLVLLSLFDRGSPGYSPVKTSYVKVWKPNFDFATSPRAPGEKDEHLSISPLESTNCSLSSAHHFVR